MGDRKTKFGCGLKIMLEYYDGKWNDEEVEAYFRDNKFSKTSKAEIFKFARMVGDGIINLDNEDVLYLSSQEAKRMILEADSQEAKRTSKEEIKKEQSGPLFVKSKGNKLLVYGNDLIHAVQYMKNKYGKTHNLSYDADNKTWIIDNSKRDLVQEKVWGDLMNKITTAKLYQEKKEQYSEAKKSGADDSTLKNLRRQQIFAFVVNSGSVNLKAMHDWIKKELSKPQDVEKKQNIEDFYNDLSMAVAKLEGLKYLEKKVDKVGNEFYIIDIDHKRMLMSKINASDKELAEGHEKIMQRKRGADILNGFRKYPSFTETWDKVVELVEKENMSFKEAAEHLQKEMNGSKAPMLAATLEHLIREGEIELNDAQIDAMTYKQAKEIVNDFAQKNNINLDNILANNESAPEQLNYYELKDVLNKDNDNNTMQDNKKPRKLSRRNR